MPTIESAHKAEAFMKELLEANESLDGIVETYGHRALVDILYLQQAILCDGHIDVEDSLEWPAILRIISALTSAKDWLSYTRMNGDSVLLAHEDAQTPSHRAFLPYSVIALDNNHNQIFTHHVYARNSDNAFSVLARKHKGLHMIASLPGHRYAPFDITYPGTCSVDARTILEKEEFFSPPDAIFQCDEGGLKTSQEIQAWLFNMEVSGAIHIHPDMTVDVVGDVDLSNSDLEFLPIKFGVVKGDFDIRGNGFNALNNMPKEVTGDVICSYNPLSSLEGMPEIIGGSVFCDGTDISSLKGLPKTILGLLCCKHTDVQTDALLRQGADVNAGNGATMYAALSGNLPDMVRLLIAHGADLEVARKWLDVNPSAKTKEAAGIVFAAITHQKLDAALQTKTPSNPVDPADLPARSRRHIPVI